MRTTTIKTFPRKCFMEIRRDLNKSQMFPVHSE
ncbi:hypothetical protein GQS_07865 [Thermococcus sp. 4557]|nr:hypothetical protein GQS_07865 [Thermococcus sp. 4557]